MDSIHKIESRVFQVKWQSRNRIFTTNIPRYPWDDVKSIKKQIRKAALKHVTIISIKLTKAMVTNPLIERA